MARKSKTKKSKLSETSAPIHARSTTAEATVPLIDERDGTLFDSPTIRRLVSIALIGYMSIVLLGPLSNPVGSEFLTRPLANFVAPVHRALFLGHGYRFFGPDPGPSHSVIYRIADESGNVSEKRFPDREQIWPRLMYHRWFMLSESVFQEHSLTPSDRSFQDTDTELETQVNALRAHGKIALSRRIEAERSKLTQQYENTRERIDKLVAALAGHLLKSNHGQHIELFVQERNIPFPVSVLTGESLADKKFLSPLAKIGEFRLNESGNLISLELKPNSNADPQPETLKNE